MTAMRKRQLGIPAAVAVLILSGCSQTPTPSATQEGAKAKEAAVPPEPVPAKTAFWPMYTSARNWATDFMTLKITAKEVPGFKNEDGKAAMWEATFGSPSKHEYRVYTYAIAAKPPDIYKGVVIGRGLPWSGITRAVMAIPLSQFNVDSDAAYKTAAEDAGAWLKKNPDVKLATLELGNAYKFGAPVWFFMWGNQKHGYAVYVNAVTGKVLKGM